MGVLNTTPDSFYDGGKFNNISDILNQVDRMLNEGATFIDVGGYSSRPGADHVSEAEELQRVVPVAEEILKRFPETNLSIDTFRSRVASAVIEVGGAIINDISAGQLDENMLKTVGELGVPYIMMHMKGTPQNMQNHATYENITSEVIHYFSERIAACNAHQIKDIIIDPGFGFSKTLEQNYELLNKLDLLNIIGRPILVGVSRKSMIYKLLDCSPEDALNGTTSLHTVSLLKGAKILRVHDVKEAVECVQLINQLQA